MAAWNPGFERTLQQSIDHHKANRLADAERGYRQILTTFPEDPRALQFLGVIALQTGHLHEAEALLRRARHAAPDSGEICSNLGLALAAASRVAEARALFSRAIDLNPDLPEAHHNLGLAFEYADETDAAIASYRRAIALKPDYADALCNLAIALHSTRNQTEAVPLYRRALDARPDIPRLDVYLGAALAELGDAAGAKTAFDNALRRNPNDPLVPFCRAHLAYENGDVDGSLALLRVAMRHLATGDALSLPEEPVGAGTYVYAVERYADALRAATERLAAAGIEAFIIGGTLLAARREGQFFRHDKDVDLAVMPDVTPRMLDAALLVDPDFTRIRAFQENELLPAYRYKNFVAIDVFRFFRQTDALWCGLMVNGRCLKWLHRPFRPIAMDWLGMTVKVPDDPDFFLAECYGPDWRIPNPHFAMWASPNLEGGFPPVARCLAYGQIFRAAFTGHRDKTLNLCAQALALDVNDDLVAALRDRIRVAQLTGAGHAAVPQTLGHAFENLSG